MTDLKETGILYVCGFLAWKTPENYPFAQAVTALLECP